MDYAIRVIRADEWKKARELRLEALQDPVAHLAFLETYDDAVARPDAFWQERAAGAAEDGDGRVRQFVAETPGGRWLGTVTVLVERPDDEGRLGFGEAAKVDQTHVVGVYMRPEARGSGVIDALFEAAVEWSWGVPGPEIRRVRLYVHEENERAAAFYRRFGFVWTGVRTEMPGPVPGYDREYELVRGV
ncbi:GNAT family N-acetyltransferase [Streptomyces sp. NPDC046203]|uniref:GNAT family N-acetyltransferase n=1 Tax=Streptomyces sp. NPDC046203 TaxID=3154602 RepID=UPI0033E0032F